jgi:hypothetical protein
VEKYVRRKYCLSVFSRELLDQRREVKASHVLFDDVVLAIRRDDVEDAHKAWVTQHQEVRRTCLDGTQEGRVGGQPLTEASDDHTPVGVDA